MSKFLSKQRNAAERVKLTKQPTKLAGTSATLPAKQIRSTTYLFPPGSRGVSKPE